MSTVTNYIITASGHESDIALSLETIFQFQIASASSEKPIHVPQRLFLMDVTAAHERANMSGKALEADVWIGAANGFGPDEVRDLFQAVLDDRLLAGLDFVKDAVRAATVFAQMQDQDRFHQAWPAPAAPETEGDIVACTRARLRAAMRGYLDSGFDWNGNGIVYELSKMVHHVLAEESSTRAAKS